METTLETLAKRLFKRKEWIQYTQACAKIEMYSSGVGQSKEIIEKMIDEGIFVRLLANEKVYIMRM